MFNRNDGYHRKLNEQTKYTITFDSKGGSAVNSITAEAGSAINAPDNPTKAGYEFVGWYESNDFGATLNDTPFTFSYMPARVFTLYAKWGLESIKGKHSIIQIQSLHFHAQMKKKKSS